MAYICLSYTPASRNLAEQVHRRLETNDFRVWRREPDLIYADASSAAILDAAFKGAAAFVFVWSEGETVPTYLTEDYHVARTFKRPIYFVNQIGQIEQLITALRQTFPTVDSFGPLPVLALDQPAQSDDIGIERSSQLIRLLSIGAAGLGLLTVIALFLLTGRNDERESALSTLPADSAATQIQTLSNADRSQTPSESGSGMAVSTLTPTPSPTATRTASPTASPTFTLTPTPPATATPTSASTATSSPVATASPTRAPSPAPIPLLIQPTALPTTSDGSTPSPTAALPLFATNTPRSGTQAVSISKSGG